MEIIYHKQEMRVILFNVKPVSSIHFFTSIYSVWNDFNNNNNNDNNNDK